MMSKDTNHFEPHGQNIEIERYALSSFTRMRYCYKNGYLDFKQKGSPKKLKRDDLYPWFDCPIKVEKELKIVFGHWSTLGFLDREDVLALDTGCLWGGKLTAYCLEDKRRFSVPCEGIPIE
jgi:bis(5'-nucleosyl)-tetraphosphatase (symmetrical)